MKQYPKISTILIADKDALYPFTITTGTTEFSVSARSGNEFKVAFDKDSFNPADPMSQGDYLTVQARQVRTFSNIQVSRDMILYFSCDTPGEVLEIESWR